MTIQNIDLAANLPSKDLLAYPVTKVEVLSDGLTLRGNMVEAPFGINSAVILHGAAAKGDPLVNLVEAQQILARGGVSTLAIRLRGVGEGVDKSDGNYDDPLNKRVVDGTNAMNFLRVQKGGRLHLIAGSMNAQIGAEMARQLGDRIHSLVLLAAAAYPSGAENVPLGPEFSTIIRDPNKDLTTSPAFSALKEYQGPVFVAYGETDAVIDDVVKENYRERAATRGAVVLVPEVGHVLLSATSNPAVKDMYRQAAEFMRDAT